MMKPEIIKKKKEDFAVEPILHNYNKIRKTFKWSKAREEITYFKNGRLNAAYNAITRHALGNNKHKIALHYEDGAGKEEKYTFLDLENLSNKFANVLKKNGVKKGDRIFIFLPRIPALYVSFIGVLKTGGVASTLFAAFGENALIDRLGNSGAGIVITNDELNSRIRKVRKDLPQLRKIIVVNSKELRKGELSYEKEMETASKTYRIAKTRPEDYAFMLFTSGTTAKPKGVMHVHDAIVQQYITSRYVLDLHENDSYWCTADPGWVTGISYTILGPWSAGVTSFVYGGNFDPEKWFSLLEKHQISVWYTAPTALRMIMDTDARKLKKYDLSKLRHICSVGEPLNPEAIRWGRKFLNKTIHDNWWQTETGAMMIANYPSMDVKVGSMGRPLPGIMAAVLGDSGEQVKPGEEGNLAIKKGWPSMMRTIWKNKKKYDSYFKNGWYFSGDRARVDEEGYFWFIGRADDVIKTSGERVGPFEVESTLIEHPAIIEAGVIGKPDPTRGQIIKAFVKLRKGVKPSKALEEEIKQFVKKKLAGHAYPKEIEFRETLPKTRSGKIMRRLLKAEELGLPLGDVSSLEEY